MESTNAVEELFAKLQEADAQHLELRNQFLRDVAAMSRAEEALMGTREQMRAAGAQYPHLDKNAVQAKTYEAATRALPSRRKKKQKKAKPETESAAQVDAAQEPAFGEVEQSWEHQ